MSTRLAAVRTVLAAGVVALLAASTPVGAQVAEGRPEGVPAGGPSSGMVTDAPARADGAQGTGPPPRATVAIVGDVDRFNIGQDGDCGPRTEIDSPSGKSFRIPAGKATHFFVLSRLQTPSVIYTCQGHFSFVPVPGKLHIVRYALDEGSRCRLELYVSAPGGTPSPMQVEPVPPRSCIGQ